MTDAKTIRLLMPQWQGGDNPHSFIGAQLLAWLAPPGKSPLVEVPVPEPTGNVSEREGGIVHRAALIRQLETARSLIDQHRPDKIVVFGGDCLVDQAPFAYLNERYDGLLGVLWLDAHPDIKVTGEYPNAHTMVLGNLLGEGDPEFAKHVNVKLSPDRVMFAGLRADRLTPQEQSVIDRLKLRVAPPEALAMDSGPIIDWIRETGIRHIAIHFDLDVLDPQKFRSVFFAEPEPETDPYDAFPAGRMSFNSVRRVIADVAANAELVGLGITEHLPWDVINLRNLLQTVPILHQ